MSSKKQVLSAGYNVLLERVQKRIHCAQVHAILSANQELILLYWRIGQEIQERQQTEGWGAKVIERLSQDLRHTFPRVESRSRQSLYQRLQGCSEIVCQNVISIFILTVLGCSTKFCLTTSG